MTTLISSLLRFCLLVAWPSVALGAVVVNPNDIDVKYRDGVEVAADVPVEARVTIDVIVDFNRNGQMDGPDFIWQHYDVRDEEAVPPAGSTEVADTDGLANGQILFRLGSFFGPYEPFPAGQYIIRVRWDTTEKQGLLTVRVPAYPLHVSGRVLLNGITPTPGLMGIETDEGDRVYMMWTDESGNYAAPLKDVRNPRPESFVLYGLSLGGSFGENTRRGVTLYNQSVSGFDLKSEALPYRCQGRVVWAGSQTGVPYLILSGWSPLPQRTTVAMTDEQGNFDFGVDTGYWEFYVMDYQARGIAMKRLGEAEVTNYDITGIVAQVKPVTCYIYGTVEDVLTHEPIPYVELHADNETSVDTRTDGLGQFAFGVSTGTWYVEVDHESAGKLGFLAPGEHEVTIYAGFRLLHDFQLKPAEGWVNCTVQDEDGKRVSDVQVECCDARGEWYAAATTGLDGTCRIAALLGADWVSMSEWSVEARGYEVPPERRVLVESMSDKPSVNFTLLPAGWPTREYEVWAGDTWPENPFWPELYGYTLLGKARSSAMFDIRILGGLSPQYYLIVTHQGMVKMDAVGAFMGNDPVQLDIQDTGSTDDWELIGSDSDGAYAVVGVVGDNPENGYVLIEPVDAIRLLWVAIYQRRVPPPPIWLFEQPAVDDTYRLEWAKAGNYELEFDTSPAFGNPVVVDVSGLTSKGFPTQERKGFFRLREK